MSERLRLLTFVILFLIAVSDLRGGELRPIPLPVVEHPLGSLCCDSMEDAYAFTNSVSLRLIAEIEAGQSGAIAFGDTDHDGFTEIILSVGPTCGNYRILEERGNNTYTAEYTGACLLPYATGDLDQDGKAEIIGQAGATIQIYESTTSTSYPTELVWSSGELSNVEGLPTVGDTDRDGKMEIIHSQNFFGGPSNLVIFENEGDNAFAQVYSVSVPGCFGEKLIADLDEDSLIEIAFITCDGLVQVFESRSDDIWEPTWSDSTGMVNAVAVEGGFDTDGNGRIEFFVTGNIFTGQGVEWTTMVYEASCDNDFNRIASFSILEQFTGAPRNALGNLDNDGPAEYLIDTKAGLWIFEARSPGQWHQIAHIADPGPNRAHTGVYVIDLNRNSIPEVIWEGPPASLILEDSLRTSDVGVLPTRDHLAVVPNPFRVEATLQIPSWIRPPLRLSIYNVAGRLVDRRTFASCPSGQLAWSARHLNAGMYFLRLENPMGHEIAVGRGIVAR